MSHQYFDKLIETSRFYLVILVLAAVGVSKVCQSASITQNEPFFGSLSDAFLDDGVPAQVEFLTKLRSKRDMSSHPYHIIQVTTTHKESLTIHLVKDEDIIADRFKAVVIGDKENFLHKSDVNCLYSGIISGNPQGFAALTSCDRSEGFTGHLIVGEEHFVIEPDNQFRPLNTSRGNQILHHRVYRSSTILKQLKNNETMSRHFAHRVPEDEYNKAISGFSNTTRFDDLDDEETSEEKSTNPPAEQKDTGNTTHESPVTDSIVADSLLESDDSQSFSPQIDTNTFAVGSTAFNHQSKAAGKKKKGTGRKGVPRQMSVAGKKVLEIAVFTDPELFKLWTTRYPKDTKAKLKSYVLNLVNNMNLLYKQPSLGVDISFRLVYLEMMGSSAKAPENFDGESEKYLKAFCKYAGEKNTKGADWDHATLLSGMNLKDGGDKSLAGLAWFSTMCLKFWSCSVSEAFSFGSTFVLAHEIGHSLGMEHDGTKPNKACSPDKFIMSPYTGEGRVTWSSCSNKNLKDYISKGTSTGETNGAPPFCLVKASPIRAKSVPYANPGGKFPGDFYKAKVQCQYDCGTGCTPNSKKSENFCRILSCNKPGTVPGISYTKDAHPALEGTTCGVGKICRHGKCVKSLGGGKSG